MQRLPPRLSMLALQVPASTLGTDLSSLLETGENADVTFTVGPLLLLTDTPVLCKCLHVLPASTGLQPHWSLADPLQRCQPSLVYKVYTHAHVTITFSATPSVLGRRLQGTARD